MLRLDLYLLKLMFHRAFGTSLRSPFFSGVTIFFFRHRQQENNNPVHNCR